jgi:hypothetical protein
MTFHYLLKPNTFLQRKGLEETKAIFPGLRERIASAMENLQNLLACISLGRISEWKLTILF